MAKVHFAPSVAIKYVGKKAKEFHHSLARPRPVLKQGDIVIVDKRTGFNLVHKGFGDFKDVLEIGFVKADAALNEELEYLKEENEDLTNKVAELELLLEEQGLGDDTEQSEEKDKDGFLSKVANAFIGEKKQDDS
jgi:hypothetical protein